MRLIILMVGLLFSVSLLKYHRWAGTGLSIFFLVELLFRDSGLFMIPLLHGTVWGNLLYILGNLILCFSVSLLYKELNNNES